MKQYIAKVQQYITEDIWRIPKFQLSRPHLFIINILRVLLLAIKGFLQDKCSQKSSALTFYSLLSVVPVVALIFGIAKGFGLAEVLETELRSRFNNQDGIGHEAIINYIIPMAKNYLDNTKGSIIIGVGLILLFWSVMRVLGNIEQSFNEIWEVNKSRSFARKFADYIALLFISLIFIISSSSMIMFVASKFDNYALLSIMGRFMTLVLPYVLICVVFVILMLIMPNTKVNFVSALIGGVVAGILFQLLQYYYIHFQVGVSKYNAIYGSFAALPLFLIWLQMSWLIVLFGAELSFAVQNVNSFEFEADTKNVSTEYKRIVALFIASHIIKRFAKSRPPYTPLEISIDLKLPIRLVNSVLHELLLSHIVIEVTEDDNENSAYQPAMDINLLSAAKVLELLDKTGSSDLHFEISENLTEARQLMNNFKELRRNSESNILLKDL